jgi:hypothetical protein
MLLHAPAATAAGLPPSDAWLDQLGLERAGAGQLRFGGGLFEWVKDDAAASVLAQMQRPPVGLIGLNHAPDAEQGVTIALRCAEGDTADVVAVQRLCALAGLIASTLPGAAIGWLPARLWSSPALFGAAVSATERQGLPPVMHLVGFDVSQGAHVTITTDGLNWFCGHELRLTAPSPVSAREAIRRAARLAVDALVHDGLAGPMIVDGIETGEKLVIGRLADGMVSVELCPPPD